VARMDVWVAVVVWLVRQVAVKVETWVVLVRCGGCWMVVGWGGCWAVVRVLVSVAVVLVLVAWTEMVER
jgi:hypothetical protein